LLEATIESMLQGVSVVDAQLRLMAWNTRYEQMFAYPQRLLYVGMPVARLYRFNVERGVIHRRRSIDDEVETRLEWLRKGNPYRFERQLPDGRTIEIRGEPMPLGGFVTTYSDVTEYREMLTQLEESRLELEGKVEIGSKSLADTNAELRRENRLRADAESRLREVNLSKSRFMSATSHDLLQPINAARLFVAALRPELRDLEGSRAKLDNIDRALSRAEQLIEELREIARLDSGAQELRTGPFAIDGVLRELYSDYAPTAERKGLRLRLRSSSLWIVSDRRLVYRILQNLLGNAIKYSREGTVLLGVRRRRGVAELQVLDQGPGINEADQARVFTEFERLDSGRASDEEGLGLGLAIVSRYASLLKLPLKLRSSPGAGSVFSISVPLGAPALERGHHDPSPVMDGRLQGTRVLCIDNDARVREGLVAMLGAEGCQVAVVSDRHELRAALGGFRPDVVVADYHLDAGDTGIAALHWALRGADRQIPVIIVSADDGDSVREAARRAGYRCLPKPINPARLTALIYALGSADTSQAERSARA
jgi:signal transduction histidine kinase/CheY-like chemotaxis protein